MTLDEALLEAHGSLKTIVAMSIGNYRAILKKHGATDAQINAEIARYSEEMDLWKEVQMAKLKADLEGWIARDGASLTDCDGRRLSALAQQGDGQRFQPCLCSLLLHRHGVASLPDTPGATPLPVGGDIERKTASQSGAAGAGFCIRNQEKHSREKNN